MSSRERTSRERSSISGGTTSKDILGTTLKIIMLILKRVELKKTKTRNSRHPIFVRLSSNLSYFTFSDKTIFMCLLEVFYRW